MVNNWPQRLLDSVFPQQCLLCRQPSHHAQPLCADCRAALPRNDWACEQCALPLPAGAAPGALCEACLEGRQAFDRVLAPLVYGPGVRELIQAWKFHRQAQLTRMLAELWLACLPATPTDRDLLLVVPLHWRRHLWRGFNQAALLARALQHSCPPLAHIPLQQRGLKRRRHTPSQARLGAAARALNLAGAFQLRTPVAGLRVAVIDDVVTTAATANQLAGLLKDAGAVDVQIWCLARTPVHGS